MLLAIEYCENSEEILMKYGRAMALLNMLENDVINKPLIEVLGGNIMALQIIEETFIGKKIGLLKIHSVYSKVIISKLYSINDNRVKLSHGIAVYNMQNKKMVSIHKDKVVELLALLDDTIKESRYILANRKKLRNTHL